MMMVRSDNEFEGGMSHGASTVSIAVHNTVCSFMNKLLFYQTSSIPVNPLVQATLGAVVV